MKDERSNDRKPGFRELFEQEVLGQRITVVGGRIFSGAAFELVVTPVIAAGDAFDHLYQAIHIILVVVTAKAHAHHAGHVGFVAR